MLNLVSASGGRQRHPAANGRDNISSTCRPAGASSPVDNIQNGANMEQTAVTKATEEALQLLEQLETYVEQQIDDLKPQKSNIPDKKPTPMTSRRVTLKLLEQDKSAASSDSGIASDCSRSLCTSDDEEHDVIDRSGDVSVEASTDTDDIATLRDATNEDPNDDSTGQRPCPADVTKTSSIHEDHPSDSEAQPRPSTPVVHRTTSRRRNAVSHGSVDMEAFLEQPEDEDGGEDDDDESLKTPSEREDAGSEGGWVDDSDNNNEGETEEETEKADHSGGEENDCERYCRRYQRNRFQVFGTADLDVFDDRLENWQDAGLPDDGVEDAPFVDASYSGRPGAAGTYDFPSCLPTDIDDVIDFWETDFQVGDSIVPCMGDWEKLRLVPKRGEAYEDHNRYLLFKTLYLRWVKCNRNKEQWYRRYGNKSLAQVAKRPSKFCEKRYPADCVDLCATRGTEGDDTTSGFPAHCTPMAYEDDDGDKMATQEYNENDGCTDSLEDDNDGDYHVKTKKAPVYTRTFPNGSTEMGLPLGFLEPDVTSL